MAAPSPKPIYEALALPNEALTNGGIEVLRVGVIADELFVSARALRNHAQWGDALAEVARSLAKLQAAADKAPREKNILADIEQAFRAALSSAAVKTAPKPRKKSTPRAKTASRSSPKQSPRKRATRKR